MLRQVMYTFRMILSCIAIVNPAGTIEEPIGLGTNNAISIHNKLEFDRYAVTCYICVNVSNNLVCNQFAIDHPCKPGETFCHTLHIMDSKGKSVLVNKKCTTEKECQRNKVGCVEIDAQTMCISCCDQNYCNVNVPLNSSTATFDDKITKMRKMAKSLFQKPEKALTTSAKKPQPPPKDSSSIKYHLTTGWVILLIFVIL